MHDVLAVAAVMIHWTPTASTTRDGPRDEQQHGDACIAFNCSHIYITKQLSDIYIYIYHICMGAMEGYTYMQPHEQQ